MFQVLILILFGLAVCGWIFIGYLRLNADTVANKYAMCPYCPHVINPGDVIEAGSKGWGHFQCVR